MAGKAKNTPTIVDELLKLKKERAKSFGLSRANYSGVGFSSLAGIGTGGAGSSGSLDPNAYLKVSGGSMIGPIAFYPRAVIISAGAIDIGSSTTGYSSRVIVTGEGAVDDDLNTIYNAAFSGQILYLEASLTNDITLKHNVDNIFSPSGGDVVLQAGHLLMLQFDTEIHANKWVIIGGAGFSQTPWLQNIDADGWDLLDMGDIVFRNSHSITSDADTITINGDAVVAANARVFVTLNALPEYTFSPTEFIVGTNRITFGTNQDIFSSGSTLAVGAASGGFVSLETGDLPRLLISDTYVQLNNSAAFRANANPVYLDADNDTKWQAGTDDVAQLTIGVAGVMISVSSTSTIISNTLIPSGNIDMNGADIINIDDLLFTGGTGHSITADGNGLTFDVSNVGDTAFHLFTKQGGINKLLGINEITNEITPYLDVIPGGTTDTLDLGAPANLWHHIYMGGSLFFRNLEAQAAGNDNFRIFRDADGMTWQLGLEGATEFGKISLRDKDNVERVEFNWNSTDKLTAFNYQTGGVRIRQNNSDLGGMLIMPTGNTLYSSQDFVIDVVPTVSFGATDGLQIRRNTQIKIDITDNIAFNNITTFSPNADISMGANDILLTGNITPALDSTYTIGTATNDAYLNIYTDAVTTPSVTGGGQTLSLTATGMTAFIDTGDSFNINFGANDFTFVDNQFQLNNSSTIYLVGSGYIQMDEQVGDPAAGTTSGKFYVKTVAGVAKPYFIGDGTAAVDLSTGGGGGSFSDAVFNVYDDLVNTKKIWINCGSLASTDHFFTASTTAGRTWTFPDITGELVSTQGVQNINGAKTFTAVTRFENDILLYKGAGVALFRQQSDGTGSVGTIYARQNYINNDSLGNDTIYAAMTTLARNVTNGSETGEIAWWLAKGGSDAVSNPTSFSFGFTDSDSVPQLRMTSDNQAMELQFFRDGTAGANTSIADIDFYADDSFGNKDLFASIDADISNGTGDNEQGRIRIWVRRAGSTILEDVIDVNGGVGLSLGNGSSSDVWDRIGFFGTTPIQKPTATGSKGSNAALASLLTALANLGLIVDNTTT